MLTNLWTLFHSHFSIGDQLIIIDSDDQVIVGKYIAVSEEGITLRTIFSERDRFLSWTDVRFMANDGFPVRKLMGADGSPSIELEFMKGKNASELIYQATCEELNLNKKRKPERQPERQPEREPDSEPYVPRSSVTRVSRIGGGCPWLIDECEAVIVNPGNALQTHFSLWDERYRTPHGWEDTDWEEGLVLTAPNGAVAELYDFESIFHFELIKEAS